jgi:hypothetical protein
MNDPSNVITIKKKENTVKQNKRCYVRPMSPWQGMS